MEKSGFTVGKDGESSSCPKGEAAAGEEPATLPFFSAVELHVFTNFVNNYSVKRELLREDAIALDNIFGPMIMQVMEMLEDDLVNIYQSPFSKRVIVGVNGRVGGDMYWIPAGNPLCQCMAFSRGSKKYCKHIFAAVLQLRIAPKDKYKLIDDEKLDEIVREYTTG